ncbi:hypothetical protein HY029_05565 [Candidatus Gottesmanbacteria bacterium]|nr:hypothetical protein [Candidatus Gottesmanbacteria bacterium]
MDKQIPDPIKKQIVPGREIFDFKLIGSDTEGEQACRSLTATLHEYNLINGSYESDWKEYTRHEIFAHFRTYQSRHPKAKAYIYSYNDDIREQHGIGLVPLAKLSALDRIIIAYAPKLHNMDLSWGDIHEIRRGLTEITEQEKIELQRWKEEKQIRDWKFEAYPSSIESKVSSV